MFRGNDASSLGFDRAIEQDFLIAAYVADVDKGQRTRQSSTSALHDVPSPSETHHAGNSRGDKDSDP